MSTQTHLAADVNFTANEILKVLKFNKNFMMCWGARLFKATVFNGRKSLQFRVNGFLHKGLVIVSLNEGADLYEIYCTNLKGVIKKEMKEVYFDELSNNIDSLIETGNMTDAEYQKKSNQFMADVLTKI